MTLGIKNELGINDLLSPKDKQDVKRMFDLLLSIASFPPSLSTDSPSVQQSCKVLWLLSSLLCAFGQSIPVKNVVLMTCWSEGRQGAEWELLEVGWTPPFIDMERVGGFDIFCPFWNKKMVIVDGKIDPGEQDEDEEGQDIHPSTLDDSEHNPIMQDEPDIKDTYGWRRADMFRM